VLGEDSFGVVDVFGDELRVGVFGGSEAAVRAAVEARRRPGERGNAGV
jgi:hypothetical protein